MSYDVSLLIDTGGDEPVSVADFNYTFNCAPMFRMAMPNGICGLDGKTAEEAAEIIAAGILDMKNRLDVYEELNPPNGWGSRSGAVDFLNSVLTACMENPRCTVRVFA